MAPPSVREGIGAPILVETKEEALKILEEIGEMASAAATAETTPSAIEVDPATTTGGGRTGARSS